MIVVALLFDLASFGRLDFGRLSSFFTVFGTWFGVVIVVIVVHDVPVDDVFIGHAVGGNGGGDAFTAGNGGLTRCPGRIGGD